MRLATQLHPVPRLRMHGDVPSHCEYALKTCRGATIFYFFVNLEKNAYGRGVVLEYVADV
jgi:hypothetical protein